MAVVAIGLGLVAALPGTPLAQSNEPQTGTNGDCLDFNLLYLVPGVDSPHAATVEVEAGSFFELTVATGYPHIEWRDANGQDLGSTSGPEGQVHQEATYGIICIGLTGTYPEIPVPSAGWVYQDGV